MFTKMKSYHHELKGYELFGRRDRKDMLNGRGGGILFYSKLPNICVDSVNKSEQIVHVTITNNDTNSEDIQIHCFYRSPNATDDMTEEVLDYIKNTSSNSILLVISTTQKSTGQLSPAFNL